MGYCPLRGPPNFGGTVLRHALDAVPSRPASNSDRWTVTASANVPSFGICCFA